MTFNFSLQIIQLYKILQEQKEDVISKQLLRCATSIGANVEEANAGQSRKDFIDVNRFKRSKRIKVLVAIA